jgi:ADP-heptose:LPS heptosyltransferase/glycosyltransferase involved in cell wall biosynthesis
MSDKTKTTLVKDLGRKTKILWVNEASFLRTGFSTYGWQIMKRLQATGKYEIVELASYACQSDPRWKDPRWGISWRYYGVMPEPDDKAGQQIYQQQYHFGQFGQWKFDEVLLKEKPDIVIDIRDRWMASEWQLKSPFRKCFTYVYMPCVDSHPPMPDWISDYKATDYILGYSHYASHILEREGIKCYHITNPGVDTNIFNPGESKEKARERWGLRPNIRPILCVHRNQKRKLLPEVIYSYLTLKNEYPEAYKDTVLWFHTSWPDVGFNIPEVMNRAKMARIPFKDAHGRLKEKKYKIPLSFSDVIFSYVCHSCGHMFVSPYVNGVVQVMNRETGQAHMEQMTCECIPCQKCGKKEARMPNTQIGFNPEEFADVYRAAYVHVQPAIAGADEMPMNEAKACGTPVLAPVHAAMHEKVEKTNYCNDDRYKGGMPIKIESLYTEAETMQHRCIFDKEHLSRQLSKILTDKTLWSRLCKEAVGVTNKYYNWDDIGLTWDNFLQNEVKVNPEIWTTPPQLKEYAAFNIPTKEQANDISFIKWCYSHFLKIEQPDEQGFQYWINDVSKGRSRENVVEFFKGEADKHNQKELARVGQAPIQRTFKISEFLDPNDKFRIFVVLPGTAGDLHLLTGTLDSLHKKYNRKETWGIYVFCEEKYNDILKDVPSIKRLIPYSIGIDNSKSLEKSGLCNIAFTPHIATQKNEHYVHRGHGTHLGHVYANMCGVDFGNTFISTQKFDNLPNKPYYVIHCKTSMQSKDWPIDRWRALVRLFPDVQFIQVGGPSDPTISESNVLSLCGKTTFNQMAYIIKKSEGIIATDSVSLHMASTLGTRSVGIFAATYHNICGPLNSHGGRIVVPSSRPEACQEPCHLIQCPSKHSPCITHINVREVASVMQNVFGDKNES